MNATAQQMSDTPAIRPEKGESTSVRTLTLWNARQKGVWHDRAAVHLHREAQRLSKEITRRGSCQLKHAAWNGTTHPRQVLLPLCATLRHEIAPRVNEDDLIREDAVQLRRIRLRDAEEQTRGGGEDPASRCLRQVENELIAGQACTLLRVMRLCSAPCWKHGERLLLRTRSQNGYSQMTLQRRATTQTDPGWSSLCLAPSRMRMKFLHSFAT